MRGAALRAVPILLLSLLWPGAASAEHESDGMHGRLEGDAALALDIGGAYASSDPGLFARATFRYLQTAGLYVTWMDDFRKQAGPASRAVSLGIELRPLFLPRAGWNWQKGPARLDLFIDSFSLRFGAVVSRRPGFEPLAPGLEAAVALGLPLANHADGPWVELSAGVRLSDPQLARNHGSEPSSSMLVTFTVGWQKIFLSHLADAGDRLR